VIGVYADLFRKQALDPGTVPIRQSFDASGKPTNTGGFDGVVVAPLPWSYPKGQDPIRRAPKAIGWATSYDDPVIYGSNTDDVMFFDLFRDERNSVTLHGRGGNDWLIADQTDSKGVDYLIGGKGADTFWFGYERYGKKTLPYTNSLADTTGYGGNAYGMVADFERRSDSLLFGWKPAQIKTKVGSAISTDLVSAHGNGIGFMRRNDLIAYVPGLRTSHISGLQANGRLGYQQFAPLDEALFF
jgi:Ca2+-binding RTX toxin-like protein